MANLDRLCQELETHAQSLGIPMGPSPVAEKLSQSLFLAHSTADQKFAQIGAARCLSSNAKLAAELGTTLAADCTEVVLGTSDTVFFYAAPFRYPNTGCGLLYARSLEKDYESTGAATPFDSGGLRRKMVRPDPAEPVQAFLARHELPIPGHRRYLGHVMTALFEKPADYVSGQDPRQPSPLGFTSGDERRWTHEVRIPRLVHVQGSAHLQAVFAPRARVAADPDIEALFAWCRIEQVDTVVFDASRGNDFESLRRECLGYIRRELY